MSLGMSYEEWKCLKILLYAVTNEIAAHLAQTMLCIYTVAMGL